MPSNSEPVSENEPAPHTQEKATKKPKTSMSRAQLKVAGGGWVDDTTLQLAQRQAERR
jgi:hypothetical protein